MGRIECSRDCGGSSTESYSFFLCHALISIVCQYIDVYFFALLIGIQPKCHVSKDKTSQNEWGGKEVCFVFLCHPFAAFQSPSRSRIVGEKRWQTEDLAIFQVLNFTKSVRKCTKNVTELHLCVKSHLFGMHVSISSIIVFFFFIFNLGTHFNLAFHHSFPLQMEKIRFFFCVQIYSKKYILYNISASINQTVSNRLHQSPLLQPMPNKCLFTLASHRIIICIHLFPERFSPLNHSICMPIRTNFN